MSFFLFTSHLFINAVFFGDFKVLLYHTTQFLNYTICLHMNFFFYDTFML